MKAMQDDVGAVKHADDLPPGILTMLHSSHCCSALYQRAERCVGRSARVVAWGLCLNASAITSGNGQKACTRNLPSHRCMPGRREWLGVGTKGPPCISSARSCSANPLTVFVAPRGLVMQGKICWSSAIPLNIELAACTIKVT